MQKLYSIVDKVYGQSIVCPRKYRKRLGKMIRKGGREGRDLKGREKKGRKKRRKDGVGEVRKEGGREEDRR